MGLDIELYNTNNDKQASIHWSYSTIHVLRKYACTMINVTDERDAKTVFPNLVWHDDCEGFYVGFLPNDDNDEWTSDSQIWVGSVKGLYRELQKIATHMLQNNFEGEAKDILLRLLKMFTDVEYDPEESYRYAYIIFS
jgi:hypothetical protein